jgi:Fe-S-cluster containining protein
LTSKRRELISSYLKLKNLEFDEPFSYDSYFYPSVDSQDFCLFYSKETKKCLVHEVKPETCVAGPLTFDINLRTGMIEWFFKKAGICSLAQEIFSNKQLLETHLVPAKKQIMQLVNELETKHLVTILSREEPETFKIGEDWLPEDTLKKLKQCKYENI